MLVPTGTTQVHRDDQGLLAQCSGCRLSLRQLADFDEDIALGALLQHHPPSTEAIHRPTVPAGWRRVREDTGDA